MDIAKEAWATALGRLILLILEDQEKMHEITELAESSSIRVLQKIQDILNDDELDDFACVEEIVASVDKGRHAPEGRRGRAGCVFVLAGRQPACVLSLAIAPSAALWGPKEFCGSGDRSRQGGRRSLTGVRRGGQRCPGAIPAPQNRVCPCQPTLTVFEGVGYSTTRHDFG